MEWKEVPAEGLGLRFMKEKGRNKRQRRPQFGMTSESIPAAFPVTTPHACFLMLWSGGSTLDGHNEP